MSGSPIMATELTKEAFAPFGDIIEVRGAPDKLINAGLCGRYHDLATLDFDQSGRVGISLFYSKPIELPMQLALVERHPLGSQCFIPMSGSSYLVVVGQDDKGTPGNFRAFLARPDQGVNYHRNTWHGTLMPLAHSACFTVVDWIGESKNLEEFHFSSPIEILANE
ncbi:MAG: ureidoglycolate lyase [Hyphomicrobiaceae bacterium]